MTAEEILADKVLQLKIHAILYPYAGEKMAEFKERNGRFAHYTSAETGIKMLRNNCIWLRNSVLMNDYSEVRHGLACLIYAWDEKKLGDELVAAVEKIDPGSSSKLADTFNDQIDEIVRESYLVSISEHLPEEDPFGRLSMWRAYGAPTGVAFVFNNRPFFSPSAAMTAFTSPVLYADRDRFCEEMRTIIASIEANSDFLRETMPPGYLTSFLIEVLRAAAVSTKHPGFYEEREWRVIYNPERRPSANILSETLCVGGVPQRIHKIPFVNHPEYGFEGATIPELLDRVIIGPTAHPYAISAAYGDILRECGIEDPSNKLFQSNIPLRQP